MSERKRALLAFLREHWVWWLAPIVLALLLALGLVALSVASPISAFVYTE